MEETNSSSKDMYQSPGEAEGWRWKKGSDRGQNLFRKHSKCLILLIRERFESPHSYICSPVTFQFFYAQSVKHVNVTIDCLPEGAATRGTARTSKPTTKSQKTLPSTSPGHWTQSTPWASALRSSPWTETAAPSETEETLNTGRPPELPARATATWFSASHTLPALATRRVARTQWLTADRQTWASISSVPWAQTISEKKPGGSLWETRSSPPTTAGTEEAMNTTSLLAPAAEIMATPGSPSQASPTLGAFTHGTQTPSPTKATAPRYPQTGDLSAEWPFTAGEEPVLVPRPHQVSRCPQPLFKVGAMAAAPLTLAIQRLNPCLMELCQFFQQCLCMSQRSPRTEDMRYCLEYYSWFLKNATYICQRVKRVSHSHTLKQKCLENICKSV
uniref:Isoform 2 of HERV-H LTR-associating protein 1 n=1 Tax=Homo sapiens TaxID=9606 RepID=C9JL84-2